MALMDTTVLALTAAGVVFVAYCVYYDQQRRNDPDYKQKVHERREREREEMASAHSMKSLMESLKDDYSIERYYRQESQLARKLIARGEYEEGISHLANGLFVCHQPTLLLEMWHASLPVTLYRRLIQKLHELTRRVRGEWQELRSKQSQESFESMALSLSSRISEVPFRGYNNSSVDFELE